MSWDQTKFDAAINEYVKFTSKAMPEIMNQKAYFVARKALWFTPRVQLSTIRGELGRRVTIRTMSATGRVVRRRGLELAASREDTEIPLAKMILMKRYRKKGGHPKDAAEWDKRIRSLILARERSTGFLKSGWIRSIQILANYVTVKSGPPIDAKAFDEPRGAATPATENFPVATIINSAIARHDKKGALEKYGGPPLQRAFDDEAASMIDYMEAKLAKITDKANAELG